MIINGKNNNKKIMHSERNEITTIELKKKNPAEMKSMTVVSEPVCECVCGG